MRAQIEKRIYKKQWPALDVDVAFDITLDGGEGTD